MTLQETLNTSSRIEDLSSSRVKHALDIIMPVYFEGDSVCRVVESLIHSVKTSFRLLICYDKEEDPTLKALDKYKNSQYVDIHFVKNKKRGVLEAIKSGIDSSEAEAVMIYVADDISNAKLVDKMYLAYSNKADLVVGSRFIPGGCMRGCPALKSFLVRAGALSLHLLAGLPIKDPTNGVRIYSKRIFQILSIESGDGWAFNLELLVKSHALGLKIVEVPYQHYERVTGESKFRVLEWLPQYLHWYFYAFLLRIPSVKNSLVKNIKRNKLKML